MSLWIFPGSFDPVTLGHVDVIRRAAAQCDALRVAVLINVAKKGAFTVEERVEMLRTVTREIPHVTVDAFSGLLADYARMTGANAVVRGLRNATDLALEQQLAEGNRMLLPGLETVCFLTKPEYMAVSSSVVREIGLFGGDLSAFVPEEIRNAVAHRLARP